MGKSVLNSDSLMNAPGDSGVALGGRGWRMSGSVLISALNTFCIIQLSEKKSNH